MDKNSRYLYILFFAFFVFFGCVTIQSDVTQNFYLDGNSKIDYYEALMPTPDVLHDTYYYFDVYSDPFLLPFKKVAPEVFAKRPYVICDLLNGNGAKCNVEKVKKQLSGENGVFTIELDGYRSEMSVKQGEYFKMTKVEDNINLMDVYTYEIYKVPTTLSNLLKTKQNLGTDLEKEMKTEAATSLYEAYPNGVCISYSKLVSDCDVINLGEKITLSIDPAIDDFRKKQTIIRGKCLSSDPGSESLDKSMENDAEVIDLYMKRGDKNQEFQVTCPTGEHDSYYVLLEYNETMEGEGEKFTYEEIYIGSVERYFEDFTENYADLYADYFIYSFADFNNGILVGTDANTFNELKKDSESLKSMNIDTNYKAIFDGEIISVRFGGENATDPFGKEVKSGAFLEESGGVLFVNEGQPKNFFEMDYRTLTENLESKKPLVVVVRKDRSPMGLGFATYVLSVIFLMMAILIILRFTGLRNLYKPPE